MLAPGECPGSQQTQRSPRPTAWQVDRGHFSWPSPRGVPEDGGSGGRSALSPFWRLDSEPRAWFCCSCSSHSAVCPPLLTCARCPSPAQLLIVHGPPASAWSHL